MAALSTFGHFDRCGWVVRIVSFVICWLVAPACPAAAPDPLRVTGSLGHFGRVEDVAFHGDRVHVLYPGGVVSFDLSGRKKAQVGAADGLSGGRPIAFTRVGDELAIRTEGATCTGFSGGVSRGAGRLSCTPSEAPRRAPPRLELFQGARVTARATRGEHVVLGTTRGAYLDGARLDPGLPSLPDPHVTALAVFRERLFVGTFNGGLAFNRGMARQNVAGAAMPPDLEVLSCGGRMVNALLATPNALYVGTSDGLFRSTDGVSCTRVSSVEDAVVGLAFDGTSVWATTPGALHRVREHSGPPSDVWWVPGGSRSLQKVAASPGHVWMASEDRGAIHLRTTPRLTAKDRPFEVYDASTAGVPSWGLSVSPLPAGGALLASLRDGLFVLDTSGAAHPLPAPVGPWGLVTSHTRAGVWVGTQQGAAFLPYEGLSHAKRLAGLPDERVHCFAMDSRGSDTDEVVWIGTENGLAWVRKLP